MKIRLVNILLIGALVLFTLACGGAEEKEKEEDSPDTVEDEIAEMVSDFFIALEDYNFDKARSYVTKGSYSSIKFLDKISSDFVAFYFVEVKSCQTKYDQGTCICEFDYFNEEPIERVVEVEKYEDEWLIKFELGDNFDNIFVYDYGYNLNKNLEGVIQIPLSSDFKMGIEELLDRIGSSYVKLGFSSLDNIMTADPGYEGSTAYGYSDYSYETGTIHSSYDFYDQKLTSCSVSIDGRDVGEDIHQYYGAIYSIIESRYGKPFNLPESLMDDPIQMQEMRWFIKSYNELLILKSFDTYIQLSIQEIP